MIENEYLTQLNKYNAIAFVPSGNSMWPILNHKRQSVIVVKKTERLKVNDVALYYRKDNATVLHRVIKVLEDGYVIQGDSQTYLENVKEDCVFGVMVGFYKGKKYVSADNERYIKKVEKWYNDENKRQRKCKRHFKYLSLKGKIRSLIKKILRIKKKGN